MAESTGIDWCDATFNPWVGCSKVSPGCARCYAEKMVTGRMGRPGTWGEDGVRERTSESNWKKPIRWAALARDGLLPDGSENPDGHRPRIFCASLADAFEPRPELDPWRFDLFDLIAATPELDWLLLTKRPEQARDWMRAWYESPVYLDAALFRLEGDENWHWRGDLGWGVLPNIWIGASIENARFNYRADVLREIPAAVRFISAEPLVRSLLPVKDPDELLPWNPAVEEYEREKHRNLSLDGIDWLIVGGESGSRDARPMHPEWARELKRYCSAQRGFPEGGANLAPGANPPGTTAFFFKQWGARSPLARGEHGVYPTDVCVSEDGQAYAAGDKYTCFPNESDGDLLRFRGIRPKDAGKLLDGIAWCEFPCPLSLAPERI